MTATVKLEIPPSLIVRDGDFVDLWAGAPKTGTQPLQSVTFNASAPNLLFTLDDALAYTLNHRHDLTYEMFIAPAVFGAPVASVVLSPSAITMLVGATQATTVTLRDSLSNVLGGRTVTYDTADHSIATVNSAGVVTGVANGITVLTAYCETRSVSIVVTVNATPGVIWSADFSADFGS